MSSKLITPESPLLVAPLLAAEIGLEEALMLQQIHYFCGISKHVKEDGRHWFWKTLEDWNAVMPFLSTHKIRRAITNLKDVFKLIDVERLSKQTWYQSNWYTINMENVKALWDSICRNKQIDLPLSEQSSCWESTSHSIDSASEKTLLSQEPEREAPQTSSNPPKPQAPNPKASEPAQEPSAKKEFSQEDQSFDASSTKPKKRTKQENESREEKYVWEIAVGHPYQVFLNWRADKFYKPQGGKWETGALSFAYSEFYNNPARTKVALYPEFLEFLRNATEAVNQAQNAGIPAAVPSCFVLKPEATEQNTQSMMENVSAVVQKGAQVVLSTKSATPTSQTLPFAEAQGAAVIKSLPALEEVDFEAELRCQRGLRNQPEKEVELFNKWLNSNSFALKQEAQKLALVKRYGIERDENEDIVKVFINQNALPKAANSGPSNSLNNVDWDFVATQCQEIEKDA